MYRSGDFNMINLGNEQFGLVYISHTEVHLERNYKYDYTIVKYVNLA